MKKRQIKQNKKIPFFVYVCVCAWEITTRDRVEKEKKKEHDQTGKYMIFVGKKEEN